MKATIRAAKAVTKGYSDAQSKVRDATKNDSSSPSARELDEIAHLSYSRPDFIEIMELVDKRLNDKGKLWRHVYKALAVINHLLHAGSPQVYHYCHNNLYVFKTLREFQYIDDAGMDVGQTVRSEAKEVTTLLLSPEELKSRRRRGPGSTSFNDRVRGTPRRERPNSDPRQSAQQGKRQRSEEDGDLARAIELSKSVEEERLRKIRDSNNGGLFDLVPDGTKVEALKPAEDLLIDISDIDNSPPLVQMQYTQLPLQVQYTPHSIQPQYTSFWQQVQMQYPAAYQGVVPQFTSAMQQEAMQAEYTRQQGQWQGPYHPQYPQWQSIQTQSPPPQPVAPQPVAPQPTAFQIGSNNPFAPSTSPSSLYNPTPSPSLSSTTTESTSSRMSPATPFSARSRSRASPGRMVDERHQALEEIFKGRVGGGEGEGVDTFGNVGTLRFGPQRDTFS